MYTLKHILMVFTLLMGTRTLVAQEASLYKVGLEEMFALADRNNRYLEILSNQTKIAEAAVVVEQQKLLPTVEASLVLSYNSDGYITDRNFSNGFTVPIPDFGNSLVLEAKQIIYAGGALKTAIAMAQTDVDMHRHARNSTQQDIRFGIVRFYLQALQVKNQHEILLKNIEQAEKLILQLEAKAKEGIALKNSITQYELQLQSLQVSLLKLENTAIILNNELVELLNLPAGSTLELEPALSASFSGIETATPWAQAALTHAAALKTSQLRLVQAQRGETMARSERLPEVFAFAGNYMNGPVMIEIPVLNNNFNYWNVGVGVKYRLSALYKNKAKEAQAKFRVNSAEEADLMVKEQLMKDIKAAEIRFQESKDIYTTHLKNVELATQNYTVIRNRFLNDMALTTEMLDAEHSKLDAEMQVSNSQINILFHYYQLQKLAGIL